MRAFAPRVDEAVLADLRERLARARFPDAFDDPGWSYGTSASYLRELCAHWRDAFDWRAVEARLAAWPHGMATVEDERGVLDVHFLDARSPEPDAFPLVLVHGWPGSILEFLDVLPLLVDPRAHGADPRDAFHVVCPSIPGFGFSPPPRATGTDPRRVARAFAALMGALGHARYGAQGGDYGSVVSTLLGVEDAAHCAALHLNMVLAGPPKDAADPLAGVSEEELARLAHTRENARTETGYYAIQSTKPQSLGHGLADSPVALAAWLVEKFRAWSDCGGDVERRFTKDALLANATLYWATNTIASSCRLYAEQARMGSFRPSAVPTAAAIFPGEPIRPPRAWAEARYPNLVRWTEMPRGGHFAAMEEPALLAEDVRAFFRAFRVNGAEGAVGSNGA
ncbi:MAG: epoxide hydrolase [Myxococcales bacterium]|nr:epoxide hydrolase [Myxococcales bacterium]